MNCSKAASRVGMNTKNNEYVKTSEGIRQTETKSVELTVEEQIELFAEILINQLLEELYEKK
jgi:hypothetical protein